mgnify:CR=1 FL=1
MKVVLDVNVWVSGLLWGGVPGRILELAKQRRFTVFGSEALLQELRTTLHYSKLQSRIQYRGLTAIYLLSVVEQLVELCPTIAIVGKFCNQYKAANAGPTKTSSAQIGGDEITIEQASLCKINTRKISTIAPSSIKGRSTEICALAVRVREVGSIEFCVLKIPTAQVAIAVICTFNKVGF